MIASTFGAVVLGMWDEAAALVVLYSAAEGTEESIYARTRSSIRSLLDLAPTEARLLRDGGVTMAPAVGLAPEIVSGASRRSIGVRWRNSGWTVQSQ